MRTRKPRRGEFCDQGWVHRMKAMKRQELIREGREVPDWLIPRPAPGEQRKLDFSKGQDDGDGCQPKS